MEGLAVIVLGSPGEKLAAKIARAMPGAEIHGRAGRVARADRYFGDAPAHLRALFREGRPILGICAAGILVRALAPVMNDKRAEPPVLALSADGKSVVPLLGGHRGANRLAARIAKILGARAAITTAGDGALGLALDDPPPGWRVANPAAAKRIVAGLMAGRPAAVEIEDGLAAPWLDALRRAARGKGASAGTIRVTARTAKSGRALTIHPPVLSLGVGCERGAAPGELRALVRRVLKRAGLAEGAVACLASLDLKCDEPAVLDLAAALGVPARFFAAEELELHKADLATPSPLVYRAVGAHGVAEGAALAAAGQGAKLIVAKTKSRRATCAVAISARPIDPAKRGRARGSLAIVGIGPGEADMRTPEAGRAIALADHLVGYGPYLDLLGPAAAGKRLHRGTLGAEEARVSLALDLAARGERVALIASGDPGVYALASLVLERIADPARPDWARIELAIVPGVTAMLAAAAKAGAPLGHDFCAISLSDLLTPRAAIERRLRAAAHGDFAVALYNPASSRRRALLGRARAILAKSRPPGTPVAVARNLGRKGETVALTTLREFDLAGVDMLSIVLIGNSETRFANAGGRAWIVTPRGYGAKRRGQ